jgi:hypothetical protein
MEAYRLVGINELYCIPENIRQYKKWLQNNRLNELYTIGLTEADTILNV